MDIATPQSADLRLIFAPRSALNQPPLGIATLRGFLERHGFEVACEDLSAQLFLDNTQGVPDYYYDDSLWYQDIPPNDIPSSLARFLEATAQRLAASEQRFLGFSLMVGNVWPSVYLARRIRELNPFMAIVLGGPHSVLNWRKLMESARADFIILGDGENPLLHLLRDCCRDAGCSVPGLISSNGNGIPVLSTPTDIDHLPPPNFAGLPLDAYRLHCPGERRMLPVMRSKGCIFDCPFCSRKVHDDGYRMRGGSGFVKELGFLSDQYNVRDFYFVDSLINSSTHAMEELITELGGTRLDISWRANAATSHFMRAPLLGRLREHGCGRLNYGLETGSSKVRRTMHKPDDMGLVSCILRETHEANIMVNVWLMVGYPTEGEDEFQETMEFIERHAGVIGTVQISTCSIIPGTELEKSPERFGIRTVGLGQDWASDLSTPELRRERTIRLQRKAEQLGLASTRAL